MAHECLIPIPDIGADQAQVIEILVKPGDSVAVEDTLCTLEGDKATMDIPSPKAGVVVSVALSVGDHVGEGAACVVLAVVDEEAVVDQNPEPEVQPQEPEVVPVEPKVEEPLANDDGLYAGPAVRRLAAALGVSLSDVSGTGRKGRIAKEDVQRFVQSRMVTSGGSGLAVEAMPAIDFSQWGPTQVQPLSRIQQFSGRNLHRNWVSIPHVTQFAKADITDLEAHRQSCKGMVQERGARLTLLVYVMKALVESLKVFPHFNASLSHDGQSLILKSYYNLGVAVDTPNGLVVPVIRDVDQKSLVALAEELGAISEKARTKGLSVKEMQGSSMTLSSLGGIGGTAFTPIVNAPDVAILGLSRSEMEPVYRNGQFEPRLMLPMSLSYDHRVIDGADGARFAVDLASRLADIHCLMSRNPLFHEESK